MPETFAFQQPFTAPVLVSETTPETSPPTQEGPKLGETSTQQTRRQYSAFTTGVVSAWRTAWEPRNIGGTNVPWIAIWAGATALLMALSTADESTAVTLALALLLGQILQATWRGN